ncbi:MAG: sel1 repeat family protein [Deltaproteobacteria bacterium]|nr:sel1 repeat family protein [Deltaproteobacteria bacterium]
MASMHEGERRIQTAIALTIAATLLGCGGASSEARGADEAPPPTTRAALRGEATCTTEGAPGVAEQASTVGLEEDDPARLAAHRSACELGNLCGCDSIAQLLEPTEPEAARELYARACDAGLEVSCVGLGLMLRDGEGGDADPERAAALFASACAAGAPWGCANHADTLAAAGTREATLAALEHYATACDGGIPWGCYRVATDTLTVSNDPSLRVDAHRFDTFACEAGLAAACTHRGRLLASGWGAEIDARAAFEQFSRACEGSEAWGCTFLGQALLGGLGVPRDVARATEVLTRACDGGNGVACRSLAPRSTRSRAPSGSRGPASSTIHKPAMRSRCRRARARSRRHLPATRARSRARRSTRAALASRSSSTQAETSTWPRSICVRRASAAWPPRPRRS